MTQNVKCYFLTRKTLKTKFNGTIAAYGQNIENNIFVIYFEKYKQVTMIDQSSHCMLTSR